jgi:predicted ATPase
VLSRLGVLRGTFTLKDAQAVAASEDLSVHDVTEAICALITKSLVAAHLEQGHVESSLLETTRCYALQRLEANGERNATEWRRARYLSKVFCAIHGNWTNEAVRESMEKIRLLLDNVCSALDWAFSPSGNAQAGRGLAALFGASLFVAASPMPLSLAKAKKPQPTNHD